MEVGGSHERGIRYLNAARKLTATARFLDAAEAELVRRTADRLTEVGLEKLVRGAREVAAILAQKEGTPGSANDQG